MKSTRRGGAVTAVAAFVTISGSLGLSGHYKAPPDAMAIAECPFNKSEASLLVDVREIAEIPEFHDCQRLIAKDGRYDSLFAVFSLRIQSRVWAVLHANPPHQWRLAGVVHAGGSYPPLGIGPGINCIYLMNRGDKDHPDLAAKMFYNGKVWDCADRLTNPDGPRITALTARRHIIAGFNPDNDFPTAARWEWDTDHSQHYMGIWCSGWCEIGAKGFTSTKPYPFVDGGMPLITRRVAAVPGWYDEQVLAQPVAGKLQPGPHRGTVFPDPGLHTRELGGYSVGKWFPAARIAFPHDNPDYKSKLNAFPTPPPAPMSAGTWGRLTQIELCRGKLAECVGVPTGTPCGYWSPSDVVPSGNEAWWVRITPQGRPSKYKCVWRTDHSHLGIPRIPGTVRWRWHPTDETIWMRCGQGCCEVDS